MKRFTFVVFLAFALALSLTGCASGGPAKVTINATVKDMHYDSAVYTVPAGAEVTVKLTNNDTVEHEFAVLKLGMHVVPPFGEKDENSILWELDGVAGGTTMSGTFTAPTEPGEYDIICGLEGHIEQGMVATLIVK